MGVVYSAVAEETGRLVAIKLLRPDAITPSSVARFNRECRILARFDHPHIARLLRNGTAGNQTPYLAMEYIEGQPITDYCETRGLDLRVRLEIFHRVCLAVAAAHEMDIIHRDLKPANILVTPDGEPKLLDFGIAKLLDRATEGLTLKGGRLLTPAYASLEQIRGGPATPASDVYSLGVILTELATGAPPHVSVQIRDSRLHRVAGKAMAERPEDRYESAGALAGDVAAYLEGKPIRARGQRRSRLAPALVVLLVALAVGFLLRSPPARGVPSPSERDYLVARYLWNKLSPDALAKAETWFRSGVSRDPRSAIAHAGLADVLYYRGEMGGLPPKNAFALARQVAERAVALDPKLPQARVVLASTLQAGELLWGQAEQEFKKALELDPQCVRALQGYGCFLMRAGRLEEARQVIQRGRLFDPASPILGSLEGRISFYSREYKRAVQELRDVVDREPGFGLGRFYLGLSLAYLGFVDQAEAEMRLAGLSPQVLSQQSAWIQGRNGRPEAGHAVLESGVKSTEAVFIAAELGRPDRAFELLEHALEYRWPVILALRADPRFDPLRQDPRFQRLLKRTDRVSDYQARDSSAPVFAGWLRAGASIQTR
jgi:serine/threonine protein kinase